MCRRASNVRPRNTPKEMFAGRVARSPLVSHVEYAPRALLKLEKTLRALLTLERKTGQRRADGRTDGYQIETLRLTLDAASLIILYY